MKKPRVKYAPVMIAIKLLDQENNHTSVMEHIPRVKKDSENTLWQEEENYRFMFANNPQPMWIHDLETLAFLEVNDTALALYGYSREEFLSMTIKDIRPVEDLPALLKVVEETKQLQDLGREWRHLKKNGELIFVEITSHSLVFNGRHARHVLVYDITEHKRVDEKLMQSLALTEATLESIHNGILVVSDQGEVIKTNSKFGEMWCIPKEIIASGNDKILLNCVFEQLVDPDNFLATVSTLYRTPHRSTMDLIHFKDGRIFERITKPLYLEGQPKGRVWSFLDITERKHAEADLIVAKEKAQESDRLKSAFLSNISHEIRTPMNGILGFAELLNEPNLSVKMKQEYASHISQSGIRMLAIISDIIEISKIESGEIGLSISETNINEKTLAIYNQFKVDIEKKGIQFSYSNHLSSINSIIRTDGNKVYSILSNLLKNALKFTRSGSIDFGYVKKVNVLEFYVRDTGEGISPEQQELVFERFRQGSDLLTRNYEGAGLGLSISKAFVVMLGGNIWVESELGRGSTFYFTIACR